MLKIYYKNRVFKLIIINIKIIKIITYFFIYYNFYLKCNKIRVKVFLSKLVIDKKFKVMLF